MPSVSPSEDDPYAPVPDAWLKHKGWIIPLVVAAATIVLTAAAFPPVTKAEGFGFILLAPGLYWAYHRPAFRTYALTMLASQVVAWTYLLSWLHPVTIAGLLVLGLIVGTWVGSWFLAAWWAIPRMIGRPTPVRLMAMVGLAGGWVLVEWSRTWLFGGFPWLPLAATQWRQITLLQVAAYTGAYGTSFVLVCVNIGLAAFFYRLLNEDVTGLKRRSQELLLGLLMLFGCLTLHLQETFHRRAYLAPFVQVGIVQPDIPQTLKWDPAQAPAILKALQSLTVQAAASSPDVVLWPEAATPWAVKGDASVQAFAEQLSTRAGAPLLMGSIGIEGSGSTERWTNGAFVVTPREGLQPRDYAKRHLVPFGEYIPFRRLFGFLTKFVPIGDDFSPGTDPSPLLIPAKSGDVAFGVLICYEDAFPSLARDSVASGAEILAVLTNDAWYGEGAAAYQHAAHSVLRAVETRRPVVRCGNAGWSGWIDEFGVIRQVVTDEDGSIYTRAAASFRVDRDKRWIGRESFYVQHGDWFVAACAGLMLGGLFLLKLGPRP